MSSGLLALHAILLIVAFLITLNFYLRGARKAQITAVLSVFLVVTLGAILLLHGWKAGLLAIPLAYFYVWATTPFAKATAFRLLGHRTSAESGAEFTDLHALQTGKLSFDKYIAQADRRNKREEAQLQKIIGRPAVQDVLRSTGSSEADVVELVRILSLTGAGSELTLSAVVNQELLTELLTMRREGKSQIELAARVMEL